MICKRPVQDSHKALLGGSLKYIKIHIHSNSHIWLCSLVHYSLTFQLSLISVSRVSIVFTVIDLSKCKWIPTTWQSIFTFIKMSTVSNDEKIAKEMPSESYKCRSFPWHRLYREPPWLKILFSSIWLESWSCQPVLLLKRLW